jgi:hypothetical protein
LQQPSAGTAGTALGPFVVAVDDIAGHTVSTDSSTVTLTLSHGTFANGATTVSAPAVNGVATFTNLLINVAGSYVLRATDTNPNLDPGYGPFTINAGAAVKLLFVQQPTSTTAGATMSPAVAVAVADANGNTVTSDASTVTLSLSSGTFSGGSNTLSAGAFNGIASFSSLVINTAGTYTLAAGDGSLTGAASNPFTISAAAPNIAGTWFINGNQSTQIQQNGSTLTFTNENGQSSPGYFQSATQVVATGWGNLAGTLVPIDDGMRIAWANGTAWTQPQLAGQGFIGTQGVQIVQSGNNLTFTNENGGMSTGYIADSSHVVATGWGNLVGTLTATFEGFRINWANGTAWDMPRLGGTWFMGGSQPTQVAQPGNGAALTFINENGASSPGYIQDTTHVVATGWGNLVGTLVVIPNGQIEINWSNGTSWAKPQLGP